MLHVKQSRPDIWRKVRGYEGLYEISNKGNVRRVGGRLLKHVPNGHGYPAVTLSSGGRARTIPVHQLVLTAFRGPPPFPGAEIAHDDGDKTNPHLGNLRWSTHADNGKDMRRHGTGSSHKLNSTRAAEIRLRARREGRRALALEFGVSVTAISNIVTGKTYRKAIP